MNTIENVLMFLPALWLFAAFVSRHLVRITGASFGLPRARLVCPRLPARGEQARTAVWPLHAGDRDTDARSAWGVLHGFYMSSRALQGGA
jgi:hypothetical protein